MGGRIGIERGSEQSDGLCSTLGRWLSKFLELYNVKSLYMCHDLAQVFTYLLHTALGTCLLGALILNCMPWAYYMKDLGIA